MGGSRLVIRTTSSSLGDLPTMGQCSLKILRIFKLSRLYGSNETL